MKILVIAESLDHNASSGAKANRALIQNLVSSGFTIKVYHYSRKYFSLKGATLLQIKEDRKSKLFLLSRAERYIRKFFGINLNSEIEKRYGFSFTLRNDKNSIIAALKSEDNFDPDWVITLSQGGSFRPHHALLKISKWHSKWIAYIHDPYPMHWYPKPYTWHEKGHLAKQMFMQEVADKSRYLAYPSLLLKEWMGKHYRPFVEKGIVIPHQLSNYPEKPVSKDKELDPTEFTILHAGNLLQARNPVALIEGFKLFLAKYPQANATFVHIGPTEHYKELLHKEAEKEGRIKVLCQNVPYEEVLSLQRDASVNVILEAKGKFSPFLPGKFPHCIAAGKPILLLGPIKSEARRLLGQNYPFWSEIDDKEKIQDLIEQCYLRWETGNSTSDYTYLKHYLSADHLKETLENLI